MSLPGDAARARGVATSGPVVSEPLGSEPGVSEAGAGRVVTADEGRAGAAQDRYERRQLVGVGGMGRVMVVWDRVLGREVALKEPTPGHGPALLEEARRAATLEHPGIVPVFDTGVWPDGAPWYTMRLLRGRPLAEALAAEPDLAGRLTWLRATLAACEAVAYAHSRGVVHRDLTPSNLLLGELGETYVADWGLAALTGAPGGGGTRGYRAPEQAAGGRVDARADVYALGAVLFHVCAGGPPDGARGLPAETPPELATIIARCTAREPAARYADARALSEDLAAFLDGRRVSAYAYSRWELLRRLLVAWKAPIGVAAAATLILTVTASAQYVATVRERDRAREAEREASANLGFALAAQAAQALRTGALGEAAVLAAHALARTGEGGGGEPAGTTPVAHARAYALGVLAAVDAGSAPEALGGMTLPEGCAEPRFAADRLLCLSDDAARAYTLDGVAASGAWPGRYVDAAVHAATGRVVLLDEAGRLSMDAAPLAPAAEGWGEAASMRGLTLIGDHLLAVSGIRPHTLNLTTGAARVWPAPCPKPARLLEVAVDAAGRVLAMCSTGAALLGVDGVFTLTAAHIFDPAALTWLDGDLLVGTVRGDVVRVGLDGLERWRVPADDAALLEVGSLGAAGVWARGPHGTWLLDPDTGALRTVLPAMVSAPALEADGVLRARYGTAGDAQVRASRLPARWSATRLTANEGLSAIAISPDSATIALGGGDAYRFDVQTGAVTRIDLPDGGVVKALAWSPDGARLLATVSGVNDSYALDATGIAEPLPPDLRSVWRRLVWLANGLRVALPYGRGGPLVWDTSGGPATVVGAPAEFHELGAHTDAAALLDTDGGVWWFGGTPARAELRRTFPDARAVDLGPDGRIVVATVDALVILDAAGAETLRWALTGRTVMDVAWSPDGAFLATAGHDGIADVWDGATGRLVATLAAHTDRISAVEFSPDARWLVTASWDHTARRWSLAPLLRPAPDPAAVEARWGITLAETLGTTRW